MNRMRRLNGWQRLWVVISVGWLFLVAGAFWNVSGFEPDGDAVLRSMPWEEQALLLLERVEGTPGEFGGRTLLANVDKKDARALHRSTIAAKAFAAAYADAKRSLRYEQVSRFALLVVVPIALLYAAGWSVGWIYRGFRMGSDT